MNTPLDVHPFATFLADERFNDREAAKHVRRSASTTGVNPFGSGGSWLQLKLAAGRASRGSPPGTAKRLIDSELTAPKKFLRTRGLEEAELNMS